MSPLLVLAWLLLVAAARPECRWQCDDPVCHAACTPVCEAPRCTLQCGAGGGCATAPVCATRCLTGNANQSETDACPACETVCEPPACPGCSVLCEAPVCAWNCVHPHQGCVRPQCELVCEAPACAAPAHPAQQHDPPACVALWSAQLLVNADAGVLSLIGQRCRAELAERALAGADPMRVF